MPAFCPMRKTWPSFLPSGDQVTLHGVDILPHERSDPPSTDATPDAARRPSIIDLNRLAGAPGPEFVPLGRLDGNASQRRLYFDRDALLAARPASDFDDSTVRAHRDGDPRRLRALAVHSSAPSSSHLATSAPRPPNVLKFTRGAKRPRVQSLVRRHPPRQSCFRSGLWMSDS